VILGAAVVLVLSDCSQPNQRSSLRGIMLCHFSCLFEVARELGEDPGRRSDGGDGMGAPEQQEVACPCCALLAQRRGSEAVLPMACREVALPSLRCLSPGMLWGTRSPVEVGRS